MGDDKVQQSSDDEEECMEEYSQIGEENILDKLKGQEKEEWEDKVDEMKKDDKYSHGKKMNYPENNKPKGKDFYAWNRDPERYVKTPDKKMPHMLKKI